MGAIWGGHALGNRGDRYAPTPQRSPLETVFPPQQGGAMGLWALGKGSKGWDRHQKLADQGLALGKGSKDVLEIVRPSEVGRGLGPDPHLASRSTVDPSRGPMAPPPKSWGFSFSQFY